MLRVLRPGGRLLILEFGMPDQDAFGKLYRSYLTHLLPRIGGALSGDRAAYTLPRRHGARLARRGDPSR